MTVNAPCVSSVQTPLSNMKHGQPLACQYADFDCRALPTVHSRLHL